MSQSDVSVSKQCLEDLRLEEGQSVDLLLLLGGLPCGDDHRVAVAHSHARHFDAIELGHLFRDGRGFLEFAEPLH